MRTEIELFGVDRATCVRADGLAEGNGRYKTHQRGEEKLRCSTHCRRWGHHRFLPMPVLVGMWRRNLTTPAPRRSPRGKARQLVRPQQ